jgi:hypothetical protein
MKYVWKCGDETGEIEAKDTTEANRLLVAGGKKQADLTVTPKEEVEAQLQEQMKLDDAAQA